MSTVLSRHAFRTDNAAETMAPIVSMAQEALAEIEESEFDRHDALMLTVAAAKWRGVD
ncbi:hypothetical protein OG239_24060 [Streptomyces sp. NBC_00868]|uniref:hypothetical protein n=1 Tax=unclassified Streptomyces TaxID=2593676 RepID=UPI00325522BF|nr:hypothetical protein OG239_24060 [Streptomyces sp. NBC_00868]